MILGLSEKKTIFVLTFNTKILKKNLFFIAEQILLRDRQ